MTQYIYGNNKFMNAVIEALSAHYASVVPRSHVIAYKTLVVTGVTGETYSMPG